MIDTNKTDTITGYEMNPNFTYQAFLSFLDNFVFNSYLLNVCAICKVNNTVVHRPMNKVVTLDIQNMGVSILRVAIYSALRNDGKEDAFL